MDRLVEEFRRAAAFASALNDPLPSDKKSLVQQVKPHVLEALGRGPLAPSLTPSEPAPTPPAIDPQDLFQAALLHSQWMHDIAKAGYVRRQ